MTLKENNFEEEIILKKLYGIGVGPGDSEYITLKGYKLIKNADVIFIPDSGKKSFAGEIAEDFIKGKKVIDVKFPMKKCNKGRYKEAARIIDNNIKDGTFGIYLTIGDPMIYSTFSYLMVELKKLEIDVKSIPGVSSFNAAANRIKMPLTLKGEKFYLADGNVEDDVLEHADTVCILKTSRDKDKILNTLERHNFAYTYISRCGCQDEKILYKKDEILKDNSYMSLILGRKRKINAKIK